MQSLDLSQCNLQQIEGTRLVFLPKLSGLNLAKNCLEEWPLSCGKGELPLRALDVSNNPLGDIPVTALSVCFSTLTSLKLSGKPLQTKEKSLSFAGSQNVPSFKLFNVVYAS